jgi:hypothetical protein
MKQTTIIVFLNLTAFLITGCGSMMILLGDNIRHSISGTVQSSKLNKGISNVEIALKCSGLEKSLYQNNKGITDEKGYYMMVGYWPLEKCTIGFSHKDYQQVILDINERNLLKREGLSWTYEVNAILEPINQN